MSRVLLRSRFCQMGPIAIAQKPGFFIAHIPHDKLSYKCNISGSAVITSCSIQLRGMLEYLYLLKLQENLPQNKKNELQ